VCYAVAGIKEHPTLSRGMSLNSFPCFRNTFPAAKIFFFKNPQTITKNSNYLFGDWFELQTRSHQQQIISKHERKRKLPTLNDREKPKTAKEIQNTIRDLSNQLEDWV
jgi:hypothetical protein